MTLSNAAPQKRPAKSDGEAEGEPMKKKRNGPSEATKAARHEAHVAKEEQKQEAYSQVASEIAPMVAAVCDSYGGCTTIGLVMQDPEILDALERIPEGCSKKMKKILELYPDYIVTLPDSGYIATAMAYDNGTVSTSGEVNKEVLKQNWQRKKEEDKKMGLAPVQPMKKKNGRDGQQEQGAKVGQPLNLYRDEKATLRLEDACADLYDACMQASQAKADAAWEAVNTVRKDAFFIGLQGFLDRVRQVMVGKGLQAGEQVRIHEVCNNNSEVMSLYNEIPQKQKKKMHKLLTDCKEWFEVDVQETGGLISVALTPEGARGPRPTTSQNQQRQQNLNRGGQGGQGGAPRQPQGGSALLRNRQLGVGGKGRRH